MPVRSGRGEDYDASQDESAYEPSWADAYRTDDGYDFRSLFNPEPSYTPLPEPVYTPPPEPVYYAPPPVYYAPEPSDSEHGVRGGGGYGEDGPPEPVYYAPPEPVYYAPPPEPAYVPPPEPVYTPPPQPVYYQPEPVEREHGVRLRGGDYEESGPPSAPGPYLPNSETFEDLTSANDWYGGGKTPWNYSSVIGGNALSGLSDRTPYGLNAIWGGTQFQNGRVSDFSHIPGQELRANQIAGQTRDQLWNIYDDLVARGARPALNPDQVALNFYRENGGGDRMGYGPTVNTAMLSEALKQQFYSQPEVASTIGGYSSSPQAFQDAVQFGEERDQTGPIFGVFEKQGRGGRDWLGTAVLVGMGILSGGALAPEFSTLLGAAEGTTTAAGAAAAGATTGGTMAGFRSGFDPAETIRGAAIGGAAGYGAQTLKDLIGAAAATDPAWLDIESPGDYGNQIYQLAQTYPLSPPPPASFLSDINIDRMAADMANWDTSIPLESVTPTEGAAPVNAPPPPQWNYPADYDLSTDTPESIARNTQLGAEWGLYPSGELPAPNELTIFYPEGGSAYVDKSLFGQTELGVTPEEAARINGTGELPRPDEMTVFSPEAEPTNVPKTDINGNIIDSAWEWIKENPITAATIVGGAIAGGGGGGGGAPATPTEQAAKKTYTYGVGRPIERVGLQQLSSAASRIYGNQVPRAVQAPTPEGYGIPFTPAAPLLSNTPVGIGSVGQQFRYQPMGSPQAVDISQLSPEQIVRLQENMRRRFGE